MKKIIIATGIAAMGLSISSQAENNYMPSYVEEGLIKICKTAATDKLFKMSKAIKEMRLSKKTVALNVMCNGKDIIAFALQYDAERTAGKLSDAIGTVELRDIVASTNTKLDVTFEFDGK